MAATKKVEKHGRVRWRVSWYDALGQRHQKFFASKADAEQHRADVTKASRQRLAPRVDPNITVKDYAARWLPQHATEQDLKPRTIESYAATLRLHVLPIAVGALTFGDLPVAAIRRPLVKALLRRQREHGYSRDSVRITLAVLSAMLEEAVEDDLLVANPAHRLRKKLRLSASHDARAEDILALTQDELDRALAAARDCSALFPLYLTLARTGLRIGEALGLDDTDPAVFDFDGRRLRVLRQLGRRGVIGTPKFRLWAQRRSVAGRRHDPEGADRREEEGEARGPVDRISLLDVLHVSRHALYRPQRAPRLVPRAGEGQAARCRRGATLRSAQPTPHVRVTAHSRRRDAGVAA